eukprot:TRINITY_DN7117_c0_g2_i1.p2 TRINITY_DN7117_c0_g2~~TRINITY_DN7117_c0_g2_i1.p2  ORF type:complete len:105 (-),score=18.77 TRINITY_DN7117_c0_g2_i1:120-434(-)
MECCDVLYGYCAVLLCCMDIVLCCFTKNGNIEVLLCCMDIVLLCCMDIVLYGHSVVLYGCCGVGCPVVWCCGMLWCDVCYYSELCCMVLCCFLELFWISNIIIP